jgi:uncharacterized protein (TIGR02266 family)
MPHIGPAKTVVIADDTSFVRDRFREVLDAAGHRTVVVKNAAELLSCLRDEAVVDLALVDLRLADAAGVDMIRAIRAQERPPISLLVFSGTIASAEEVRVLATLGVDGYVNEYSSAQHILPCLTPHLFPDNFNRRSSPRAALAIPIQYRVNNSIASAVTINLSRGGVAMRTTSPLENGARLQLKFRLQGAPREVEATGKIVWADRRVGMGVQFESVEPTGQAAIDHFVDTHFFSNRKA